MTHNNTDNKGGGSLPLLVGGYDPGGGGAHGTAVLAVLPSGTLFHTSLRATVEDVISWFEEFEDAHGTKLTAIGVDTLCCWSTGHAGWRPADRELRQPFPEAQLSVKSGNSLRGSMIVGGMATLVALRQERPSLLVTETHPKVLYTALTGRRYKYNQSMIAAARTWLGTEAWAPTCEHEWDAAISAIAALRGLKGEWTEDLHSLPTADHERLVWPAGRVA